MDTADSYIHPNQTCDPSEGLKMAKAIEFYLNTMVVVFGGPLNILVIVVQALSNRIHGYSTAAVYMTNLSVANLLTVCILPIISLSNAGYITVEIHMCRFAALLYYTSCTASFVTIGIIALDRYRIIHAKNKPKRNALGYCYVTIFVLWAAATMMGTPAPIHTLVMAHDELQQNENGYHTCVLFFDHDQVKTLFVTFKILMCVIWGIVPVAVMTWFYVFFYKTLHRVSYKKRSKTLTFICVLLLSFLMLQTPYVIVSLFDAYALSTWSLTCDNINHREAVIALSRVTPNFHCLLNPILYAFVGNDFLAKLKQCYRGELFSKRAFTRAQQTAASNAAGSGNTRTLQRALRTSQMNK